jgi:hypothetical protein
MINPDRLGIDLGYGTGWRNGWDYASSHPAATPLPVSENRSDPYATGFRDGAVIRWCDVHTVFGPPPEPLTERELTNAAEWGKDVLGSINRPVGSAAGRRVAQYLTQTDGSLERLGLSSICRTHNSCYRRIFGVKPDPERFRRRQQELRDAEQRKAEVLAARRADAENRTVEP